MSLGKRLNVILIFYTGLESWVCVSVGRNGGKILCKCKQHVAGMHGRVICSNHEMLVEVTYLIPRLRW